MYRYGDSAESLVAKLSTTPLDFAAVHLNTNLSADGYVRDKIGDFSVYENTEAYRVVTTVDERYKPRAVNVFPSVMRKFAVLAFLHICRTLL